MKKLLTLEDKVYKLVIIYSLDKASDCRTLNNCIDLFVKMSKMYKDSVISSIGTLEIPESSIDDQFWRFVKLFFNTK